MQKAVETAATGKPLHTVRASPVLVTAVFAALTSVLFASVGAEASVQESNTDKETVGSQAAEFRSARFGTSKSETVGPQVAGFRSARFGMSKSETIEAIQHDFQIRREDVLEQSNDEDKTSSLIATVAEIFPGSEPAQVVYIHGYKQAKLIQVNILWGSPVTGEPDPQALVATANVLRKYFEQLGFDPGKTVTNTRVDDGAFIVFRATDEQERMVLLQLLSRKVPGEKGEAEGKPEPQNRVVSLWLSYIEDIRDPDVFKIKKGTF